MSADSNSSLASAPFRHGAIEDYIHNFAGDGTQGAYSALLQIRRELSEDELDGHAAEAKYARRLWWQQDIERMASGQSSHPNNQILQPFIKRSLLAGPLLSDWIETLSTGVESFSVEEDLIQHLSDSDGRLHELFEYIEKPMATQNPSANALGQGVAWVTLIRGICSVDNQSIGMVPKSWLNNFKVDQLSLKTRPTPKRTRQMLACMADIAMRAFSVAEKEYSGLGRINRMYFKLYSALLKKMERDNFCCRRKKIALSATKKLLLAWRSALNP